MNLEIRPMSRADLSIALGWARDEGWNPGIDDGDAFYAQDPSGFFMGWVGDEPVGCVSVVKYGGEYAFLGLYIVRPAWRGKGYGKAIWDAGIASAGHRTIGLDGVVAQQANYQKSGFVLAHRSARWSGLVSSTGEQDPRVRPVTPDLMQAVQLFDGANFPATRPRFLAPWLHTSNGRWSMCAIEQGQIVGYGTIRRAVEGFKIGPLFAQTADVARSLIHALSADLGRAEIFIDIPQSNNAAVLLAQDLGLKSSFETARMYRGTPPAVSLEHVFGITTLELG